LILSEQESQKIRAAFTGPFVFTLRLFPIIFFVGTLQFSVGLYVFFGSDNPFGQSLAIAALSFLAVGCFWFIIQTLLRKAHRRIGSPVVLLVLSGLGGMVQVLVATALVETWGLQWVNHWTVGFWGWQWAVPWLMNFISGFLTLMLWLPFETIVLAGRDWSRKNTELAQRQVSEIRRNALIGSDIAATTKFAVSQAVENHIVPEIMAARVSYRSSVEMGMPAIELSTQLRNFSEERIRPFSTDLWNQSRRPESTALRYSFRTSVRRVIISMWSHSGTTVQLYPALATLVMVALSSSIGLRRFSPVEGLVSVAFAAALFYGVTKIGSILMAHFSGYRSLIFIGTLATAALVPFLKIVFSKNTLLNTSLSTQGYILVLVIASISLIGINLGLAVAGALFRDQERESRRLNNQAEQDAYVQAYVNSQVAIETGRWAAMLHGQVQSKFAAAALCLELAGSSDDQKILASRLEQAERILSSIEFSPPAFRSNVGEEIAFRVESWMPVVRIDTEMEQDSYLPEGIDLNRFGEALEECISNAVRHAQATHIKVRYARDSHENWQLLVSNDGSRSAGGTAGMGTSILNEVTQGNWTIQWNDALMRTQVRLNLI